MDAEKFKGIIVGVISLVFFSFSTFLYISPPQVSEGLPPEEAGPYIFILSMGGNILGIIFAGLTKIMLKHSKIFGALFISSALLNLFILTGSYIGFPSVGLFAHMLFIVLVWLWPLTLPFTLSFLVGVSLIIPSRTQAFTRKELMKETIDFGIVGSIFGFYGTLSFFVGVIGIFEAPPFGLIGLAFGAPLLWAFFRASKGFYKYVKLFRTEQRRDKLGTDARARIGEKLV